MTAETERPRGCLDLDGFRGGGLGGFERGSFEREGSKVEIVSFDGEGGFGMDCWGGDGGSRGTLGGRGGDSCGCDGDGGLEGCRDGGDITFGGLGSETVGLRVGGFGGRRRTASILASSMSGSSGGSGSSDDDISWTSGTASTV